MHAGACLRRWSGGGPRCKAQRSGWRRCRPRSRRALPRPMHFRETSRSYLMNTIKRASCLHLSAWNFIKPKLQAIMRVDSRHMFPNIMADLYALWWRLQLLSRQNTVEHAFVSSDD